MKIAAFPLVLAWASAQQTVYFTWENHNSKMDCTEPYPSMFAYTEKKLIEMNHGDTATADFNCFQGGLGNSGDDVAWREQMNDRVRGGIEAGGYFRLVCDSEDNVGGTGDFGLYYHGDDPTCSLTAGIVPLNGWYGYKRCYEDPASGNFLKPMGCSTAEPHIETVITREGCFPAHATVTLADKSSKRMDELELGDRVHVGGGEFSEVFHFTTLLEDTTSKFVKLTTQNRSLILSHEHYLYVDGRLKQAQHAKIGDTVTLSDGSRTTIQSVGEEWARGLYNPHTLHGDVVVDGVLTSTYTGAVNPTLAHALLLPLRQLYSAGLSFGTNVAWGAKQLPAWVKDAVRGY